MVANDKIQQIIDRADIVEVISDYVSLEKIGNNYRGLCPFHDDSNPSFYVSPTKKIASCMSCKEGGNVITILQKLKKITFEEALVELGERYQVAINIKIENIPQKNQKYYEIADFATRFYQFCLEKAEMGPQALEYLHKRGLNDETISRFKIGLAPKDKDGLYRALVSKGFSEMDMMEAGVVKKGERYYDLFNNRIMFPIIDENNRTIGFSGRLYYEDPNQPKYVNSSENALFNKSYVLYNLNNAQDMVRKRKRIIITEGFLDVIACHNAGLKETICTMGTAFTPQHVALIRKYTKNIILCFDGDEAGIHATKRAIDLLLNEKMNIAVVSLKEGLDPDEFTKKYGNEQLNAYFDNEMTDYMTFLYHEAKNNRHLDNVIDAEAFKLEMFKMLSPTVSQTIIEKYIKRIAGDLNVSNQAVLRDFQNYYSKTKAIKNVEIKPQKKEKSLVKNGYIEAYRTLIRYMFISKKMAYEIHHNLDILLDTQRKYIPNIEMAFPIIGLIYQKENRLDTDDEICISQDIRYMIVNKYYNENIEPDIDIFNARYLNESYRAYFQKFIMPITVVEQNEIQEKIIKDCLIKLECFIVNFAIDKYKDIMRETPSDDKETINQLNMKKITLKKELESLRKKR